MLTSASNTDQPNTPASHLRGEYEAQKELFQAQPPLIQRFLEAQARQLAEAMDQHLPQTRFVLPDRVIVDISAEGKGHPVSVPAESREQMTGGFIDRLTGSDIRFAIRQRLVELENETRRAVSVSAGLLRYATVIYMIYGMLPDGRSVTYVAAEGEEIPSIPQSSDLEPESAITARTDAIVEEGPIEAGRGELVVPYVPAARRFYLPQWVAFDGEDRLLVKSISEAEAHIASMQRFLAIIHTAVFLAPYMVADDTYQQKRYGMLGQIVNQGRALARYTTGEIIQTIKHRAATHDLNRGLSLSLPYFDDQSLEIKTHDFTVIPAGRIMFLPAFVVRAADEEQAKVAQDTRLSPSTRRHLLAELKTLETAFTAPPKGR